jgi:hypothetical protein
MTPPLKIEVTEAMREAAEAAFCKSSVKFGRDGSEPDMFTPALTAAFQHPEFLRQIREQVMGCVPSLAEVSSMAMDSTEDVEYALKLARASLGRLLGEE